MLPRSFFSASSLKSPQTNNANNSGDEATTSPQRNLRQSRRGAERDNSNTREINTERNTSPILFPNESDAHADRYMSADSLDSSSGDEEDEGMSSNLQDLMLQLRQQQERQARYVEKTRRIGRRMQKTSLKIAQLTGMGLPHESLSPSNRSRSVSKSVAPPSPSHPIESDGEQPLRRPMLAKRSAGQPRQLTLPPAKIQRPNNSDEPTPLPMTRKTGPRASSTRPNESMATTRAATPSSSSRVPKTEQINLASQNVCDLYLNRNQDVKTTAFAKKPRSLLFNIAEKGSSMSDLLISTSLKGDMQFWNASTRSLITNVGPERLNNNGWIEELCWVTPTTLALCMGRSRNEHKIDYSDSVHLAHIKGVKAVIYIYLKLL
ncbi:hypothetical protein BDA99DRAFT_289272 [Phascolomyces articulosus]|uniref:Uncharacterized protein n=1 Tax=Phascolomyces articulosus TaxID=60185 RepID=A0AAD5JYC8_9FUNG|nr:hypothetical protein BDA99DRAFT_289272 [Phascolomyces articulosus]